MQLQKYEQEHIDLVEQSAGECTVLLKTNNCFPLGSPCKIAAFGNGVRHTVKGGTGSGEVNSRFSVNIEEGLKAANFEIVSGEWLDKYDEMRVQAKKDFIKRLKAEAREKHQNSLIYGMGKSMPEPEHNLQLVGDSDVAIYVLTRDSGEGNDRSVVPGDVKLANSEIRDILECNRRYDKFMLVLNVGGVVDLSEVMEVQNILLLSQLGVVTGNVLADILLGKQIPSGKLTTTWAKYEDYSTIGNLGDPYDTYYKEGIFVGYRYFDTLNIKPLFPFGFGLSYTNFNIEKAEIKKTENLDFVPLYSKTTPIGFELTTTITNTGTYSGKETVEYYINLPNGKLKKAKQELIAFNKTKLLSPGESEILKTCFALTDFSSYDEETSTYILEKGDYILRYGNNSRDTTPFSVIRITESIDILKARNLLGDPGYKDYEPEDKYTTALENISNLPVIEINASEINTTIVEYEITHQRHPLISTLSDEELALMCVGAHDPSKKGIAAVIGNAATHIAGGAGETCSQFESRGISYLTMADGPAGLRLAREYYRDNDKCLAIGASMLPESMYDFLSTPAKFIMKLLGLNGSKAPKNAKIEYQYATAIPIGTAIAQSWNTTLAEAYGNLVGKEMQLFGVNLWLAPALNIHRSILCGRNFEYYSEDPLISGLMATAITTGVQKHPGCGTTIKHYAANNQELNRYNSNSNVSERAMREIYLKGFGLCVVRSQPNAIMTSYNLLNGVHTSEHRGLIEGILRAEYGYNGISMTDWNIEAMSGKNQLHRSTVAGEVAKAGNDLFMPGCKKDQEHILSMLSNGSLTREQLEINATRTYRMIKKLKSI